MRLNIENLTKKLSFSPQLTVETRVMVDATGLEPVTPCV